MNKFLKIAVVIGLIAIVTVVLVQKQSKSKPASELRVGNPGHIDPAGQPTAKLPRLVDLGAGKCIPCKMMAPILEELKTTYKDKLDVVFIDVWEHPDQAKPYNINLIPTQIFFSPEGKELFRHEGFFSKEDILAKWKELGFDFTPATGAAN